LREGLAPVLGSTTTRVDEEIQWLGERTLDGESMLTWKKETDKPGEVKRKEFPGRDIL